VIGVTGEGGAVDTRSEISSEIIGDFNERQFAWLIIRRWPNGIFSHLSFDSSAINND
jgi:hypothetical protein